MNFYTPAEVAGLVGSISERKSILSIGQLLILGILAGAFIAFGANLATVVGSDISKYLGNGFGQFLFGAVFSTGLMMVVIGGAELFTGNNMFMVLGALNGNCTWGDLLRNWIVVFIANFIGSILIVYLLAAGFYGFGADSPAVGLFQGLVGAKALLIAKGKLELTWTAAFARAILCNWMVCMAVWLALASKDVTGKILGILFPIMAFVASGFEHSVANMFFIPMGITASQSQAIVDMAAKSVLTINQLNLLTTGQALPADAIAAMTAFKTGAASILNWKTFLMNNLIPVTLGNIIGGAIFVAVFYWYAYLYKDV